VPSLGSGVDPRSHPATHGTFLLTVFKDRSTRHIHHFEIPLPRSTETDLKNPDKAKLRDTIVALRSQGMSYREIGRVVGLHFTRVQQILKFEGLKN
jgi:hypothetical protein